MGQEKIEYRVMGDYSIAKSFKGILRIAHVMERVVGENDVFSNKTYYGAPTSLMNISGSSSGTSQTYGHSSASEAFEGKVERYLSDKEYKNLKLPVTDSVGNYLNWNLGTEDSTIGSDIQNNGSSLMIDYFYQNGFDEKIAQPVVFPVLESKELIIGLESKVHPTSTGGKKYFSKERLLEIVNDEKNAMLVITNLFDHSSNNLEEIIEKDDEGKIVQPKFPKYKYKKAKYSGLYTDTDGNDVKVDDNIEAKYRTVIRNTKAKIEEYDAFVYSQENYNVENFEHEYATQDNEIEYNSFSNVKKHSQIDAEVDVVNLKEYVKDIIKKFMKSNVVEVPTGTVIHQYISPEKWYAHGDRGTGSVLNNIDCFVGHRPSMQLRNYDVSSKEIMANMEEEINRWNSTTNQGASVKSNRLILGDGEYKEKDPEDEEEMNDSAFDTSKLSEIIPLYKRDYLLCDGSTYHIYLIENDDKTLDIKRKYATFDRFFNLFYNIGYNYTIPLSENNNGSYMSPFSATKTRYACAYDGGRYRFLNLNNEIINQYNAISTFGTSEGTPKEIFWNNEQIKNLKDCETLYSADMTTMLAYKILIDEDKKGTFDSSGKFNRNLAENWLKSQKIPKEYIFNTFVGDTNETFLTYEMTPEAAESLGFDANNPTNKDYVMEIYYRHNKDVSSLENCSLVRIGREVNSFNSVIKYFVPTEEGGKYVICCAWQIPEIQYILDVLISGSGERNKILPRIFDYKYRVPNLTESTSPKFVGSTGFNWRDQKENELSTEETWTSTISVGTSPHRHAIFKSLLGGFSLNSERDNFKGYTLSSTTNIPSGSINYHDREDFPQGGKNGSAGKFVTDKTGSYIWNELGPHEGLVYGNSALEDKNTVQDISRSYILQRSNFPKEDTTGYPLYYTYDVGEGVTGVTDAEANAKDELLRLSRTKSKLFTQLTSFGDILQKIKKIGNKIQRIEGPPGTRFPKTGDYRNIHLKETETGNDTYEYNFVQRENVNLNVFPSETETDLNVYFNWYDSEITKWYSFEISEDPRFNNAEPNRCITGRAIPYTISGYTYNKNQLAAEGNSFNNSYYFAPENIKMLPLIKL